MSDTKAPGSSHDARPSARQVTIGMETQGLQIRIPKKMLGAPETDNCIGINKYGVRNYLRLKHQGRSEDAARGLKFIIVATGYFANTRRRFRSDEIEEHPVGTNYVKVVIPDTNLAKIDNDIVIDMSQVRRYLWYKNRDDHESTAGLREMSFDALPDSTRDVKDLWKVVVCNTTALEEVTEVMEVKGKAEEASADMEKDLSQNPGVSNLDDPAEETVDSWVFVDDENSVVGEVAKGKDSKSKGEDLSLAPASKGEDSFVDSSFNEEHAEKSTAPQDDTANKPRVDTASTSSVMRHNFQRSIPTPSIEQMQRTAKRNLQRPYPFASMEEPLRAVEKVKEAKKDIQRAEKLAKLKRDPKDPPRKNLNSSRARKTDSP
jgi:hypothetical protein